MRRCSFPLPVLESLCNRKFDPRESYRGMEYLMSANPKNGDSADDKVAVTLPGTVEKIIPSIGPNHPEKAQIAVQGAEDLYREIRVENTLQDDDGNPVSLKLGAEVEVTIDAGFGRYQAEGSFGSQGFRSTPPAGKGQARQLVGPILPLALSVRCIPHSKKRTNDRQLHRILRRRFECRRRGHLSRAARDRES